MVNSDADYTHLYLFIKPINRRPIDMAEAKLEKCLKLKLNVEKTEFLAMGTPQMKA